MKKIFALLSLLILALALTGCGGGEKKDAKAEAPKFTASNKYDGDLSGVTLNIGAAQSRNATGVVKAAGLDNTPYKVNFHNLRGGNLVIEALAANQIDAGCGSQIPPIFAAASGNDSNLKIVAIRRGATLNQEVIVGPKTKDTIKTIADLKGKKVAYVKNTTAHYFLNKMLEDAGLKWDDVETLAMSTSDAVSAILTGDIDAFAGYGSAVMTAKSKGAVTLQTADKILTGDYYWYATPETLSNPAKRAALLDYLERINEANEWIRVNPEVWSKYYAKETNQKVEDYRKIFDAEEAQVKSRIAPITDATIADEQDIINTFVKLGVLKSSIDAKTLFDRTLDEGISKFKVY